MRPVAEPFERGSPAAGGCGSVAGSGVVTLHVIHMAGTIQPGFVRWLCVTSCEELPHLGDAVRVRTAALFLPRAHHLLAGHPHQRIRIRA